MNTLLTQLKIRKGEWISGEALSREMGISRTAVWKQIRGLKARGYAIEASTRKGYRFLTAPDLLLSEEIRTGLETRVFGRGDIVCLPEADSTNNRAKALAEAGAPEGALVLAEAQSGGRGRRGRNWFSPAGSGIYMSLILRPEIPPAEAARITLMSSVAVAEAVAAVARLDVKIKWPNDVLAGAKKIAGILTEISTEMDSVNYVVVGIGINVGHRPADFPPDIRSSAGSIFSETGRAVSRTELIRSVITLFERRYFELKTRGFQNIRKRWCGLSGVLGRSVVVESPGGRIRGTAESIDGDGSLLVRNRSGVLKRLFSGDVSIEEGRPGEGGKK
ncbi:MAG TPA: biotin--[acetyl-CoA-carboxylase] ligase [Syntrophales bacterium]|mgnify:CR=1 FL=1|nr:biotin--[acetyl-CoA-carboxylase] ligase [Syntrophales bacterium]